MNVLRTPHCRTPQLTTRDGSQLGSRNWQNYQYPFQLVRIRLQAMKWIFHARSQTNTSIISVFLALDSWVITRGAETNLIRGEST